MRKPAWMLVLAVVAGTTLAQPPLRVSGKLPSPIDAISLAAADAATLPPDVARYTRYLWVTDGSRESGKAISLVLNMLSSASTIIRPVPIGKGNLLLMRFDARWYAPRSDDLVRWQATWEKLSFDPRFNVLITPGTLKFSALVFPDVKIQEESYEWKTETVNDTWPGGKDATGQFFPKGTPYTWERKVKVRRQGTSRLRGRRDSNVAGVSQVNDVSGLATVQRVPHPLIAEPYAQLAALTHSQTPIVTDRYFVLRALSTIQDAGIAKDIYGGLYYDFAGIRRGAKKGTDEDVLFESLGVGSVDGGVTAKAIFDKLRSDQRAAMFRSGVTGNPRRLDFFRTLAGRLDTTSSLIAVTHDLRQQDVDIDVHPIANLLDFKDAARETIWEKPNGLHGYALFDGTGKLQEAAPDDVVRDHGIPPPHSSRLQGASSCISCHEADGSGGWRKFTNDVRKLTARGLNVFGDQSAADQSDIVDRLRGLYDGDPERALAKGRNDYAAAVLRATGPWPGSILNDDIVQLAGTRITSLWRSYQYDMVTPLIALREAGIEATAETAGMVLSQRLRKTDGPLDVRLESLRLGLPIPRADFDLIYAFFLSRIGQ